MITLTKKDIERIGYGRYIRAKSREFWIIFLLVVGVTLAAIITSVTKGIWGVWPSTTIGSIIIVISFIPFYKVCFYDAEKAGKEFLIEWEKEHGTIPEETK